MLEAAWRERFERYGVLWGLLLVVGVLSLAPLARLLAEGIAPQGHFSVDAIVGVVSSRATTPPTASATRVPPSAVTTLW